MPEKVRILFLAANPKASQQLRLDEEIREIQARIRAADFQASFELLSRWAVRPRDLLQAFNEVRPHIVHFSGHGSPNAELILEDEAGAAKPVSEAALVALFKGFKDTVRLVVLNACHSESQAIAVSQEIDCAVGMSTEVGDRAAILFASHFYGALGFGMSVGQAFEQGRTALLLEGIPEEDTPVLLARVSVDALRVDFVSKKPINPVLPALALEILQSAVTANSPINLVRYDGGACVQTAERNFDDKPYDLEYAAELQHAIKMLVQAGWIDEAGEGHYLVNHAGYVAGRKLLGRNDPGFAAVVRQMPELIAEMKADLQGRDDPSDRLIREFMILPTATVRFSSKDKPRFTYIEKEHPNLRGKLDVLENHGYIKPLTTGLGAKYRMTEGFVRLVVASSPPQTQKPTGGEDD